MIKDEGLDIVILGLSITSSWGNGHASTYRALVWALTERGHRVLFLERDLPWYAAHRDLAKPPFGRTALYADLGDLRSRFTSSIRQADLTIVGSFVPEGAAIGEWVTSITGGATAFYDIDTPITLAKLERGDTDYLSPELVPRYDLYLSFTGGPTLERIERRFGSPMARPLYCSVDPRRYYPEPLRVTWELGYMGTYSADRQPSLDRLLLEPAGLWSDGRFVVVGPMYPPEIRWPANVERIGHLPPAQHRRFYNSQRFTLNLTRRQMVDAGYSPSVRLFEAAACGTPIITDAWDGLHTFFEPDSEILVARGPEDVLRYLRELSEVERVTIALAARQRVLDQHTADRRAARLESYIDAMRLSQRVRP